MILTFFLAERAYKRAFFLIFKLYWVSSSALYIEETVVTLRTRTDSVLREPPIALFGKGRGAWKTPPLLPGWFLAEEARC